MAQSWSTEVLDGSLDILSTLADRITVCAGAPASYAEATTIPAGGKMLAQAAVVGGDWAKGAGAPDGRKITLASKTDSSADASGTADHIAIVDDNASILLAVSPLSSSQVVTAGNTGVIGAVVFTNRALSLA